MDQASVVYKTSERGQCYYRVIEAGAKVQTPDTSKESNVYTGFAPLVALKLPSSLYNMLPYIISLVVLAFISQKSRAPKAEGIPYDKGQR